MTKREVKFSIEHVGFVYVSSDDGSEVEEAANRLLEALWDAYDEAEG